jgi:TolB-like protein/Flp pilus assembly protein TadD/class 3 adenylate cyclase
MDLMPETQPDFRLEIAHVLFMDIVGFSKSLINEQSEMLRQLNQIARNTAQVKAAEAAGKLTRLPTGDGMALAFFTTPDAPLRCAIEIAEGLKEYPTLPVRMGINSGPVDEVMDVNERSNLAGAGINIAQRVMDCGDAGHILLSKRSADDLAQYGRWRPHLHELGPCEIKHGTRIEIVNFHNDEAGNLAVPEKLKREKRITAIPKSKHLVGALLAAAVVLLTVGIWLFSHGMTQKPATASAIAAEKRIAILPFKPLLPENRDQVLELGMADTLIAKLSNTRAIIVTSFNSVRKFTALDQDALAAGHELHVNSVLEGNVQRVADRIRVTARLLSVPDGASLWSSTYDEKFTDVFAVQDAISQKVADALALRLTGEEKDRLTRRYTDNLDAYQLYMTGRYHWSKLTPPDIRESITFFQRAIDLDPTYVLAYFGMAEANRSLAINADVPSKDCLPQAEAAARKAIELDDSLAEAHASLSFSLIWYDWDWGNAEKEARRAIALNPNSAHAHFAAAHVFSDRGRADEAIPEMAQARKLDPLFMLYRALEGLFFLNAGKTEEALARLQSALEQDANFWVTHLILGRVYIEQRKYPEAIAELTKAKDLSHGNSEAIASVAYAAALSGDQAQARAVLAELQQLSAQRYIPPSNLALALLGVGEKEKALALLERAIQEHDVRLTQLKVDPRWNSLRSDLRFIDVLKRIGLQ